MDGFSKGKFEELRTEILYPRHCNDPTWERDELNTKKKLHGYSLEIKCDGTRPHCSTSLGPLIAS